MGNAVVGQIRGLWFVRISNGSAREQVYRCATEDQARRLAMVFSSQSQSSGARANEAQRRAAAVAGQGASLAR